MRASGRAPTPETAGRDEAGPEYGPRSEGVARGPRGSDLAALAVKTGLYALVGLGLADLVAFLLAGGAHGVLRGQNSSVPGKVLTAAAAAGDLPSS